MHDLKTLSKEILLELFISTVEDSYYHHDTGEQEKAKNDLPKIKEELLNRMV